MLGMLIAVTHLPLRQLASTLKCLKPNTLLARPTADNNLIHLKSPGRRNLSAVLGLHSNPRVQINHKRLRLLQLRWRIEDRLHLNYPLILKQFPIPGTRFRIQKHLKVALYRPPVDPLVPRAKLIPSSTLALVLFRLPEAERYHPLADHNLAYRARLPYLAAAF